MKNLGDTIKKLREEADLNQTELAKRCELSLAYINKLEDGNYKSLSLGTSRSLADGLGLSLSDFLNAGKKKSFVGRRVSEGGLWIIQYQSGYSPDRKSHPRLLPLFPH